MFVSSADINWQAEFEWSSCGKKIGVSKDENEFCMKWKIQEVISWDTVTPGELHEVDDWHTRLLSCFKREILQLW